MLGKETSSSGGLERGTATTKTWTNGTGSTTTKLVLSKTFTNESPRAHTIAESGLFAPALLNVRRNEHTTDRFFWGEKGLFSAQYAEENHFLFPSLRSIVDDIGESLIFEGLELTADDWEEIEEYEYAFV